MMRAPPMRSSNATKLNSTLFIGWAMGDGPKAPQVNATRIAEQHHVAWEMANPARGIATKLNRAANTKRLPPSKPPRVKEYSRPAINATGSEERKTPAQAMP